jgi:uncharacterized protein YraI
MRKRYWALWALLAFAVFKGAGEEPRRPVPSIRQTQQPSQPPTPSLPSPASVPTPAPKPSPPSQPPAVVTPPAPPKAVSQQQQQSQPQATYPLRFVRGNGVAFRSGPSTGYPIIDRFDSGREVALIEQTSEWSHVRDRLTQRDGWMASRFLGERHEEERPKVEKPKPKKVAPPSVPVLSDSTIIQRIIAESLAAYPGSCPCPYNRDRGGRACGRRSAYSKPGGYSPICYAEDVSRSMIEAFRRR